jgi:simple sugar transport system permease protein
MCNIPLGIVIALIAAFAVKFIFDKTVFGFELKAVGTSRRCARYIGVNVRRSIVLSMAFSGIFAGLAGVTYYLGYTNTMVPKTLPGMGYDSIAVALLGSSSPIGAIFASIIVTIFQSGANYMSSSVGVAKEIASLITGILLLFAACGEFMKMLGSRKIEKEEDARIAAMQAERVRETAQKGGTDR